MSEVATEDRLALARSYVKQLEYDAQGTAEEHARIRRHLDAVRAAHAAAVAAGRGAKTQFEDALEDLGTRLAIARHRLAAERTDHRHRFENAVEAELRDSDAYLWRLERRAARHGRAADQSRSSIRELTSRRDEVAERLRELRAAPDETWREHRERVEAALDRLERAVDGSAEATGGDS